MTTTILEVTLSESNDIQFKLRPTTLNTTVYGEVLCEAANHIAQMMAQEGGFPVEVVYREIVFALIKAIEERPFTPEPLQMLQ